MKRSKSCSPEPSGSGSNGPKRSKAEESSKDEQHKENVRCKLLDLSDDVLLHIMKNLQAVDLLHLGLCCQRLNRVIRDRTLWEKADFRDRPLTQTELKEYAEFLHPTTKSLAISARTSKENPQLGNFFCEIVQTCVQLKELIIENYKIDVTKVQIKDFPLTIEKLSMKGTVLKNLPPTASFFSRLDSLMPSLTCLILSGCNWFQTQSLLPLSKLPKLKELKLDSCSQLCECVAYASLAARFGFKALEILDVRNTALGDSDISSFSFTETLTHLFLENPMKDRDRANVANAQQNSPQQYLGQRVYEDDNLVEIIPNEGELPENAFRAGTITDRAVCSLSSYSRYPSFPINGEINVEWDENKRMLSNPKLKVLVVRNYPRVSDQSLSHLTVNAPSLEYLDLTGTAVTQESVKLFRASRKNVKLVTSFDKD